MAAKGTLGAAQRRAARRTCALLVSLHVLLGASLLTPAAQALSLGGFKNSLVTFLLEKISVPGEFEVSADEVQSPSDGFSLLKGLRVSDAQGVWFRAEELSFAFSPSKLLLGKVQIDSITIKRAHLDRLPQVEGAQAEAPQPSPSAAAWPRSPIALDIPKIDITSMRISDAILPQTLTFDATGTLRDEGDEQSVSLSIKRVDTVSGSIELSFLKRFDDDRLALNLAASEAPGGLVAKAASLPADVAAALKLDGSGTPAQWDGRLELDVDGMLAARGSLAASWLQRIGADLALTITPGPRLAEAPRLAIGEQANVELRLREDDKGVVQVEQARVEAQSLRVAATGTFSRNESLLDLALDVSVDRDGAQRLSPLIRPLGFEQASFQMTAKGPLDAAVFAGRGDLLAPSAEGFAARNAELVFDVPTADGSTATLSVVATSPSGPGPAYAKLFGQRVSIELVTRRSGETIDIDTARIDSAAVQLGAAGQVMLTTPIGLDVTYTMTVPDVAPFAALADLAARGALHSEGSASGVVGALTTRGSVRLSGAVVNGQRLGRVDLSHETRIAEQIAGNARLQMASTDFGKGSAAGAFVVQEQSFALDRLQVDLLGVKASGNLSMPARARFPLGKFDFTVTSLQPLGRLSGQQLSGSGRGSVRFAASAGGESDVQAQFSAMRINALTLQALRLEGNASALASARPKLSLRLEADEFSDAGDTRLDKVSMNAEGSLAALEVNGKLAGAHRERALSATLRATAALDKPMKTVQFDALRASYDEELVQLSRPMRLSVSSDSVQVEDLDLSLPDEGRLRGWFKHSPETASVDLEFAAIPLRLLKVLAGAPIREGLLSGTVKGQTARDAPALDARLSMSGLRAENVPADTGALAAQLTAGWDGRDLSADLSITGPFDPAIKGRFRVPMTLAAPAAGSALPVLDFDSAIDAQLDWRGEVEPVMALLPIPDHVLAGIATIALRIAGTLNAPLPSGELTMKAGRYENLVAGTIVEDLALNSDFSDQRRVKFSLTGTDGEQGRLQVSGVVLPGNADEMLDVSARIERMLLVRIDAASVLSSADLTVKSSAEALDVKGKVVVEQAEIRLLNPLPPSIVDLGEVRIGGEPSAQDSTGEREAVVPVRLDISVDIPSKTFVRGRGLDSEWGGALRISGSASEPSIDGRIESRRGVLELIGRAFDLQRGRIVFTGKDNIDPNLDLRLVREANNITGTIFIEGTAARPSLRFTSNPVLPADEVLPRLMFGRSKQSLSGPEAAQLAVGLAALARGEESVLDVARKALGVDVLRIESADDGSDSAGNLSVGRYATEQIYVGAKQSLDGQSSSVVVEIELPKNFVVDTEVGQNADGSVGITWRKDF